MDNYIGKVGIITIYHKDYVIVDFNDSFPCAYPLPEALKHIVEEHPQRGDEVLVWDDNESNAQKRIFLTYIEGAMHPVQVVANGYDKPFKNGKKFSITRFDKYKTIPQKTKLTYQQIADKFGVDVNDLEVEI